MIFIYAFCNMGEIVPIVEQGVARVATFYEENKEWMNPVAQWGIDHLDEIKDWSMSDREKQFLRNKTFNTINDKIGWMIGRQRQNDARRRKNPRKRIGQRNNGRMAGFPIMSMPNTLKCVDLGKKHIRGRKSANLSHTVENWKTYKHAYQQAITTTAGSVTYEFLCTTYNNDTFSVKNIINTGKFCGFNGVDKLIHIEGGAAYDTVGILDPTYSNTTGNRSIVTDPTNCRTSVALRRQVVQLNWQNSNATTSCDVSVYLLQLKKDMHEYRGPITNANVPQDYFGYGMRQKYDAGDSQGEPAAGNTIKSIFTVNDNPQFKEWFKVIDKTRVCLQPGQSCRKSYIMNGNQALSYKHLLKNITNYNESTTDILYFHVAHKKGEKIFMIKVHGTMEPSAGGAGLPGYSATNLMCWWETSWQATKMDYFDEEETILANPNF